jgi:hypothetical protein
VEHEPKRCRSRGNNSGGRGIKQTMKSDRKNK